MHIMVDYKEALANIARAIVDKPEEVRVTEKENTSAAITLELSVAPDDMGKVIGKHGRIAQAIRQIMRTASAGGKRIIIDIR